MHTATDPGGAPLTFRDVLTDRHLEPSDVRQALEDESGPVLLDFDHTLFASNSTELFISSAKPSTVVALLELVARRLIPWRLLPIQGRHRCADYACVMLILMVTPWNLFFWRSRARQIYRELQSPAVGELVSGVDAERIVVASFGYEFIIRALLSDTRFSASTIVATSRFPRLRAFTRGKLAMVEGHLTASEISGATCLSDSTDDLDLMRQCRVAALIPAQGPRINAKERLYVPLRYTARAKYSLGYTIDQFLLVDFLVALLATAGGATQLLRLAPACFFLSVSLMAVYEIGYFENDTKAAASESRPTLGRHAARYLNYPIGSSWVWAVVAGVLGTGAASLWGQARGGFAWSLALWAVGLVMLRVTFFAYNRTPAARRILLYPWLQVLKYASIFLVISPAPLGSALVLAQVTTMWVVYAVYRAGGSPARVNKEVVRLTMFAVAAVVYLLPVVATDARPSFDAPALIFSLAAIVVWAAARLAKPLWSSARDRARASSG